MADRKVLNKYFPPDFDPDKLWKNKRFLKDTTTRVKGFKPKKQFQFRMMFPFTICCDVCNEFTYVGTKFNSRAEKIEGEDYLGIEIWRFYGRCPNCRNEIAFKTDPKSGDYTLEFGGTRTYDAARDNEMAQDALQQQKNEDLKDDRMKQIEAKTYNTQRELKTLESLDEIRQLNRQFIDRNKASDHALEHLKKSQELKNIITNNSNDLEEVQEFKLAIQKRDLASELSEDHSDNDDFNYNQDNNHKNKESKDSVDSISKNWNSTNTTKKSFFKDLNLLEPKSGKLNVIKKRPAQTSTSDEHAMSNLLFSGYQSSEDST